MSAQILLHPSSSRLLSRMLVASARTPEELAYAKASNRHARLVERAERLMDRVGTAVDVGDMVRARRLLDLCNDALDAARRPMPPEP